jgi:hypothetical protein
MTIALGFWCIDGIMLCAENGPKYRLQKLDPARRWGLLKPFLCLRRLILSPLTAPVSNRAMAPAASVAMGAPTPVSILRKSLPRATTPQPSQFTP